jgi:hypothetical protein
MPRRTSSRLFTEADPPRRRRGMVRLPAPPETMSGMSRVGIALFEADASR